MIIETFRFKDEDDYARVWDWLKIFRVFSKYRPHGNFILPFFTRKVSMTFWFHIAFTWWLGYFTSCYLKVHFMLTKCTCDSKSRTLRMRYPFHGQSTGRPISHRNGWLFRVYMIPLQNFVPEWNSRPGTRTGVISRRSSLPADVLWGG